MLVRSIHAARTAVRRDFGYVAAFVGAVAVTHLFTIGCSSESAEEQSVAHGRRLPSHDPNGGSVQLARVGDPAFELPINRLRSLKGLKPSEPKDLGKFVRDRGAAIALGKSFFWDMQAGSDFQACASCHFHAGADNRVKNQISPGLNNVAGAPTNQTFNAMASGAPGGADYVLSADDYPFHKLADATDPNSAVLFDSDDVTSSQGVFRRDFMSVTADSQGRDTCTDVPDIFVNQSGVNTRRVEPRNTPTMINAAFFFRAFWDGRANNVFNGVNPFGPRDVNATILEMQPSGGTLPVKIRLENASAASQAVGPILSPFEMSCAGRGFADVGKKLRNLKPLGLQQVAADDSVLGPLRDPSGVGLSVSYTALIQQAFDPKYWASPDLTGGFTQTESNFSLFWGLAIQMYESTLVSDDAPIDRFLDGDATALTAQQRFGKALFEGQAQCINCHHGPVMSAAAFSLAGVLSEEFTEENSIERMPMGDGKIALYDHGFYNIGVRPTGEDLGVGGADPFGNPLAFVREAKLLASGQPIFDTLVYDKFKLSLKRGQDPEASERDATDGCFKMPSLRNVELTGPYFHNGGQATLEQVVDFYDRGGDRRGGTIVTVDGERITYGRDSTAYGPNETNMDADVQKLFLTPAGKAAIVAFLKSFTDNRVRNEQAPFDHPQLIVPNGGCDKAEEKFTVPAVGASGLPALGLPGLKGFLE